MNANTTSDDAEKLLEDGIGRVYRALFRMRERGEYQREYDAMGTLLSMLMQDRLHLRQKHGDKIVA